MHSVNNLKTRTPKVGLQVTAASVGSTVYSKYHIFYFCTTVLLHYDSKTSSSFVYTLGIKSKSDSDSFIKGAQPSSCWYTLTLRKACYAHETPFVMNYITTWDRKRAVYVCVMSLWWTEITSLHWCTVCVLNLYSALCCAQIMCTAALGLVSVVMYPLVAWWQV